MGVDFYTCDKCSDTFPDCGHFQRCGQDHYLCPACMVDDIHVDDDTGELENEHCPVCKEGGTEVERLRARCARLEGALGRIVSSCRIVRDGTNDGHVAIFANAVIAAADEALADARARGAVGE